MKRGNFITLEGGEGAGKSTQQKHIKEFLLNKGIEVVITREPGGTPGGEAIRTLHVEGACDRWDAISEALLMNAARHDHIVRRIKPALEQGQWAICDRFADSTLAYQGYAGGVAIPQLNQLYAFISDGLVPDLTLIFDIDPDIGINRSYKRTHNETRFENKDMNFHQKIRQGFLNIAAEHKDRCVIIDAAQSEEAVKQQIVGVLERRFGL